MCCGRWYGKMSQKMFKSSIASDTCFTPSDHGLTDSLKNTWIYLDICNSIDDSWNQICFGTLRCCLHSIFQRTSKKKNNKSMLIKSGELVADRTTHYANPSVTKYLIQMFTMTSAVMGKCTILLKSYKRLTCCGNRSAEHGSSSCKKISAVVTGSSKK